MQSLSIVLINYNSAAYTTACVESIIKYNGTFDIEIIVVDNASSNKEISKIVSEFPSVRLIESETNRGFTGGNNLGVKEATGEYVLILNNDTIVYPDTIQCIKKAIQENPVKSVITGYIEGPDGIPQYSGGKEPSFGYELLRLTIFIIRYIPFAFVEKYKIRTWEKNELQQLDWATGCMFVMPRKFYNELGGFDENIFMYFDDVEFHKRARNNGAKIIYDPSIKIKHFGGQSAKKIRFKALKYQFRSTIYYFKKHHSWMIGMLLWTVCKFFAFCMICLLLFPSVFAQKIRNKMSGFYNILIA